jgi:hypothetical protein
MVVDVLNQLNFLCAPLSNHLRAPRTSLFFDKRALVRIATFHAVSQISENEVDVSAGFRRSKETACVASFSP